MTSIKTLSTVIAIAALVLGIKDNGQAAAITIESAPLGATGQSGGFGIRRGSGDFSVIAPSYLGWRFQVDSTFQVTDIGGHFGGSAANNKIFGTIISLNNPSSLPQGQPFLPEEVLASTTFNLSFPSNDITTPLSVELAPGNYGLVFGSGLFGATGIGFMPNNNPDLPFSSYFSWGRFNPGDPIAWNEGGFRNTRFFIRGESVSTTIIFEPSSVSGVLTFGAIGIGLLLKRLT